MSSCLGGDDGLIFKPQLSNGDAVLPDALLVVLVFVLSRVWTLTLCIYVSTVYMHICTKYAAMIVYLASPQFLTTIELMSV